MPESKYEFDQTRAAIGANELDNAERREMLERFKSAGGQVLREKSVAEKREEARRAAETPSPASRPGAGRPVSGLTAPELRLPSEVRRAQAREEADRAQRARADYERALGKLKSPAARFFIRLRCFMAGVTPFAGNVIKPAFVQFLSLELRQALVEFNLIGNDLFLQRPSIGKKILRKLDAKNPLLMETLEYAHHVYNSEYFEAFATAAQNGSAVPVDSAAAAIKSIYRALYLLQPFQETFRKAMGYALDVFTPEAHAAKLSHESLQGMILKQKRFHANTKIAFQSAFPRLFHLVCLADGTDYAPFSPLLEKAIQVTQSDKLGQRKKGDGSSLDSHDPAQDSAEAATEETVPAKDSGENKGGIYETKEYQYGLSLMKMRTPQECLERYDKSKRMLEKVPMNDRILLAYLYFLEFDYEYSFVLTTNKITINVDYAGGVKSDYKKQMADLYNDSRPIIKAYEKYEEMQQEYQLAKSRKSTNYIEKSKADEKAKGRADIEGRNTRGLIRAYMDNVARSMAYLIADMKGARQVVGNIDAAVRFDAEFEKGKRMNGKTVKQCILDAYCFAVAFRERLANGDLFPLTPMSEEEMQTSFGQGSGTTSAPVPEPAEA